MNNTSSTLYIVAGPTASGKSAFALDLARKIDGVIINADSMQIYDGLPILTAQPSEKDKALIPHYLYGHLHPNQACSAGNWRELVEPLIHQILATEKTPIIVGGSGLYIHALTEGLSPIPDIPDDIRKAAGDLHTELGPEKFFSLLKEHDPVMAARFHAHHKARIVRAWEVLQATGKSLAQWQTLPRALPPENWHFDVTLIMPERETLYDRCNRRFIGMLEQGAIEELATFNQARDRGEIASNALLNHALGAKPLSAYLAGLTNKDEAIRQGQSETRHYAKRQLTWFRHQIKINKNVAKISVIS